MSNAEERQKGDCPKCGPDRWAIVRAKHSKNEEYKNIYFATTWRILECPACDTIYVQTDLICSEDVNYYYDEMGDTQVDYIHQYDHWPKVMRPRPDWFGALNAYDLILEDLMDEAYTALNNGLRISAAIAIRTVFDRASELLGIDAHKSFADKLDGLLNGGKIGVDERELLDALTNAGSAAAHRGWKPTEDELGHMLSSIEGFLQRNFILKPSMKKLKESVPARAERKPNP